MTSEEIQAFYTLPHVRKRIAEYLGAVDGCPASCVYIAQPDSGRPLMEPAGSADNLASLLNHNLELGRSLWDRQSLIAHLDIEYVNFEFPHEPYIDPARTFRVQNPTQIATEKLLSRYGMRALHLLTGRGHHYVWQIPQGTQTFRQLQQVGRCNDTLLARYRSPGLPYSRTISSDHGRAFAGLGLVMEYFAGCIKWQAAPESTLPVELTAVAVGPGEKGREAVSIDVSEYGDPLYLRVVRVPFTAYMKQSTYTKPLDTSGRGPILTVVVPENRPLEYALKATRDGDTAACLAEQTTARIPDAASGTRRLISEYTDSSLCMFHDRFYEQSQHPPEMWGSTYDMMPMNVLPHCVSHILSYPNDLLMKPAAIELVVRVMMSLGWHPRHIAGLIRSKYERDHGWCDQWLLHDAATRADFYTRIFAGAFASGVDDLVGLNCMSVREKGLCLQPQDGCALTAFRNSLLERRRHGRLADRPFNGLFLPNEHF